VNLGLGEPVFAGKRPKGNAHCINFEKEKIDISSISKLTNQSQTQFILYYFYSLLFEHGKNVHTIM